MQILYLKIFFQGKNNGKKNVSLDERVTLRFMHGVADDVC
jgi:hypothetical protein